MSEKKTSWILELVDKITSPLGKVQKEADGTADSFEKSSKNATKFGECLSKLSPMNLQAFKSGIDTLNGTFQAWASVGADYDASLREVSAITGITGKELDNLGKQARNLGKEFGSSASDNLGTFQTILSRLGPDIGKSAEALGGMGKYANTLSKTMGGDVSGAVDSLTTSMLQYRVNLDDPIAATAEMERMMNVMAAGAKEGSAEVAQIGQTLKGAGVAAYLSGLSFEETNSAIQALGNGGKYAQEAGTALNGVLTKMAAESSVSQEAIDILNDYGISFEKVSDATIPFADRLKMLAPIQNDMNALNAVFGRGIADSAQILISSADSQAELTEKITGTNVAYEQAETIMGGWTEKLSRAKSWVDDLKIGCFDFTSVLSVGTGVMAGALTTLADFHTVAPMFKSMATAVKGWTIWSKIATVATGAWTAVQWALNAAFIASPIGWIVLGVGALVAAVVLCWNKFEGFRASILGVWEVIKGFGNILKDFVIDRIKGIISGLGTMGSAISKLFSGDFKGAWADAKSGLADITGVTAVKNAVESGKNLYQEGDKKGRASFQADKAEKEAKKEASTSTGAKSVLGDQPVIINENAKNTLNPNNDNSKNTNSGVSGGSGGGKSVTMNVTLNITNNGVKNPDEFTEQVVRKINDRLNDSLAAVG